MAAVAPKNRPGLAEPLTVPYLGPGWGRKALEALRTDPRVKEAVQGLEASVLTRIRDAPEGRYHWLYASFDGTGLADGRMGMDDGEADSLPDPTFTIEGSYDTFAAIQRGELTEKRAFFGGKLSVKGNRISALRNMGALEALTRALAEIPCET